MTKDLTSINDLSRDEILGLLDRARDLKQQLKTRPRVLLADGAMAALVFEKPSLRTRVTFETAIRQLGGSAVYLGPTDIGLGQRETVPDVARNLSRWVNCIIARVFEQDKITTLAENATVPVINALSDDEHPCQILADLQTVLEHRGSLEGARIAWVGDGNNVCNSLTLACGMLGVNLRVATPKGFEPARRFTDQAREYASSTNASIETSYDPAAAVKDAEFIYTDTWTSMGQEDEAEQRRKMFARFQVNSDLVAKAGKEVKVMHCLPAHRGEEITDEVLDGPGSVVLDQAENRLHAQRALLAVLLAK
ncbi:MAG: ornithine carbamoyltransferase [candidate division WOR-3 bacterium]|nr:MAG: ornithine carbamoyltransferase [candidate division WOR-3 bacterium]